MPYLFNKITVRPQLPTRINKLYDISYNLWWSWNTEFLKLFKELDCDLWESCGKNPIKFLQLVAQDTLELATNNSDFLKRYDKIATDFEDYINAKHTWFSKNYPDNRNDVIAYFSAEYGLDETIAIYSGGLGILSGDHLKSASDMGIPLVGVGMLYKHGYFHQTINGYGEQQTEYKDVDLSELPVKTVKNVDGSDLLINIKIVKTKIKLKVWQLNVGRVKLFLLDSDINENPEEYRDITTTLYGGDQEMRIKQEIVLGMGGVNLLRMMGIKPTIYHMNEGHSSFLVLELIKDIMKEKEVSFEVAKDIVSSKTVFTTHTPVPAGNDIFSVDLVEKYFDRYWERYGIDKERFLRLGMRPEDDMNCGFNMGILALKIAGNKNGVSKLHGAVSRELFGDIWSNIPSNESPIGYVTNGVHTCTWLAPSLKILYNKYLKPYWQDSIQDDETWEDIKKVPNEELWKEHQLRKIKLLELVKKSTTERLRRYNYSYDEIENMTEKLDPNVLTIGFSRRFATYKRATLIFRDLERITKIFNEKDMPLQIIFAGKAHPIDQEGKDLIKFIHELSLKPQFKGKIFILENYNMGMSRYLVSGVDVWLNNPRRPMEASGTSGQKAAVNGVINFSVLDGWWAEAYNQKNGWKIGNNSEYQSYEEQDDLDAQSMYETLENKIVPTYYNKNEKGYSEEWLNIMKNCIMTNAGRYSTSRMLEDYLNEMYIPLCNLHNKYYKNLETVIKFTEWKKKIKENFDKVEIFQSKANYNDITVDAGNNIEVKCKIKLPKGLINADNINVQVFYGKISSDGVVDDIRIDNMNFIEEDDDGYFRYSAKIALKSGGDYGYTFRAIPKTNMILNPMNLNLIKWITD
ncbi:MAG: alpha-glucan family phosphorylase [Clostridia bacterium]|nr:alpha-glucan family phosphorylase [Clostridia bacterium]